MSTDKLLVTHKLHTSDDKAPDGKPWIEYWETQYIAKGGLPLHDRFRCPCCGDFTPKEDFVGAHVIVHFDRLNKRMGLCGITPTCGDCNKKYQVGKDDDPETIRKKETEQKHFNVDADRIIPFPEDNN